ncbi:MAG: ArsR family transcriptional regulator [Candidatus Zixiibacteriota bacterium]|nr:MAG: ArsR family transcriptional regulator [candidate division Zixibacteria bacterium]
MDTQDMVRNVTEIDRLLHEPARLLISATLYPLKEADFLYLANETGLTRGNLSSHLSKLEQAGYVEIEKTYRGKIPLTVCRLTEAGRRAFDAYREHLRSIAAGLPE